MSGPDEKDPPSGPHDPTRYLDPDAFEDLDDPPSTFGQVSMNIALEAPIPAGQATATIEAALADLFDRLTYLQAVALACGRALDAAAPVPPPSGGPGRGWAR